METIQELFKGQFILSPEKIGEGLARCRAFVFDWDGVFNAGNKDAEGSSPFNEVDSMGTNLLRFNHYLRTGAAPLSAIISGETNKIAFQFAKRESFAALYCGFRNKTEALEHLCGQHSLRPEEVVFFFDDVLDLALAKSAGLRIMIGRSCNPYLTQYAVENGLVDYITANSGGSCGIREAAEMLMAASGRAGETFGHRIRYSEDYAAYLKARNSADTTLYLTKDAQIYSKDSL